jgi:hypothetical protein
MNKVFEFKKTEGRIIQTAGDVNGFFGYIQRRKILLQSFFSAFMPQQGEWGQRLGFGAGSF